MKRDFLKNLGIEDEVIDKIMAEHGKTTQSIQTKLSAKETELRQVNTDLEESRKKITEFEKIDISKLEGNAEEWKKKYLGLEKDNAVNSFFAEYKFTSDLAKRATIAEFKNQDFKLKDGKFEENAQEYMKKFIEENKEAFQIEDNGNDNGNGDNQDNQGNPYSYNPGSGSGNNEDAFTKGLDDIF